MFKNDGFVVVALLTAGACGTVILGLVFDEKVFFGISTGLSTLCFVILIWRKNELKTKGRIYPTLEGKGWSSFNMIGAPIIVFDVYEDGTEIINWCNEAASSVFDYRFDELVGSNMTKLTTRKSSDEEKRLLDSSSQFIQLKCGGCKKPIVDADQFHAHKITGWNKKGIEIDLLISIDEIEQSLIVDEESLDKGITLVKNKSNKCGRYIVLLQNVTRINAYTKRDLETTKKHEEFLIEKHNTFIQSLKVPVVIGKVVRTTPPNSGEKKNFVFQPSKGTKNPIIITECNKAASDCFGWSEDELIGNNIEILMPKTVRDVHGRYVDGSIRTCRTKRFGVGRSVTGLTKNGELKELLINMAGNRAPDNTMYYTAIFQDFTEIKKQRDASAVLYCCQAQLLQSLAIPGILVDENEKISSANPVFKDVFAYKTMNDLLGRSITDIFPQLKIVDLFSPHRNSIDELCPPERQSFTTHFNLQYDAIKFDSTKMQVAIFITRTCDSNGALRYLLICEHVSSSKDALLLQNNLKTTQTKNDSSPRKIKHSEGSDRALVSIQATEELQVQHKVLSQFTHEMRNKYTPSVSALEAIQGYIDDNSLSPETFRNEIHNMKDEVRTSLALLQEADDLVSTRLELHKIWKGAYMSEPNIETVDIREHMKFRVEACAVLKNADVQFITQVLNTDFDGMDIFVRIDMFMYRHITNNLLSNARKACYKGTVALNFLGSTKAGLLDFSVTDTGHGIPDSIKDRLFKEEVATADCRGVGLGLTSCKTFALCIGGDVWLEKTKVCTIDDCSGGTTFRFCLPGEIVKTRPTEYLTPIATQRDMFDNIAPSTAHPNSHSPHKPNIESDKEQNSSSSDTLAEITTKYEQAVSPTNLPSNDLLRLTTFYIIEDSNVIRRSIILKLRTVSRQIENSEWTFIEFPTVESFLPSLQTVVDSLSQKIAFVIDENLDSQGGQLRGHQLINALVQAGFDGLIISASGDEISAKKHRECGANLIWGKPLPRVPRILETLRLAWENNSQSVSKCIEA